MVGPYNVGQRIKSERIARAWSQTELSLQSGVSRRHISDMENGKANIGIYTMFKILGALHITLYVSNPPVYSFDDLEREKNEKFLADHGAEQ